MRASFLDRLQWDVDSPGEHVALLGLVIAAAFVVAWALETVNRMGRRGPEE